MKPVLLVLCEGETEAQYVEHLKQKYRIPIKIVSKIVGQKIHKALIARHKKELKISDSEHITCFLMYDADVPQVTQNIIACGETALLSRPCIEAWFLAHAETVSATDISGETCLRQLEKHGVWKNYKKGTLTEAQKAFLWEKRFCAGANISPDVSSTGTFSTVGAFIDTLEKHRHKA